MKPYSPEWYIREKAWQDKCDQSYGIAAQVLIEEGYKRSRKQRGPYPFLFSKGKVVVYLARRLGRSEWYPVTK